MASVVSKTGWPRTIGGVEAYVAIAARGTDVTAAKVHRAVVRGSLRVVPAVRGCIYVVPGKEAPSTLRLAELLSASRTQRDLEKTGVKRREVDTLAQQVIEWLAEDGPATTDAIRRGLPSGAVRSPGAAGKKVGLSSPLPVALRQLEFGGQITRCSRGGRLDTERYEWSVVTGDEPVPSGDRAEVVDVVVRRFLCNAGPAPLKAIATWAGCPQRDIKDSLARIRAVPVMVEGDKAESYVLPDQVAELSRPATVEPRVRLLPFEDNYVALRGGPAPLVDPEHHGLRVESWGNRKASTLGDAPHLWMRPITCGPKIVGFWEFDPDKSAVVTALFAKVPRGTKTKLRREAEALSALIGEVGHGRSVSLDSDDDLRRRVAALAKLGQ